LARAGSCRRAGGRSTGCICARDRRSDCERSLRMDRRHAVAASVADIVLHVEVGKLVDDERAGRKCASSGRAVVLADVAHHEPSPRGTVVQQHFKACYPEARLFSAYPIPVRARDTLRASRVPQRRQPTGYSRGAGGKASMRRWARVVRLSSAHAPNLIEVVARFDKVPPAESPRPIPHHGPACAS